MGFGYLKIQAHTGDDALPVSDAVVLIKDGDKVLYQLETDESGSTESVKLYAPDKYHSLNPSDEGPYYATYDVEVIYDGKFVKSITHHVEVFDEIESILPINLIPLPEDSVDQTTEVDIPPPAVQLPIQRNQVNITQAPFTLKTVVIPDYITVHLGTPNSQASNVRVKFTDYIKNVASSEIYPTWPQASLEANILAQISFALNRVFTEWYRSRGYNFDITSSTTVDQAFIYGRNIYDNISKIVDQIFNSFVRRPGRLEPFFTQFCNGTTSTCPGLSQWGTVTLANQGMNPLAILRNYYPRDVQIVASNNITGITESFPGTALREGNSGYSVQLMQNYLNRIRVNYPLIPQIPNPNGYFDANTTKAVRTFQGIFNMTQDGIIGRATWFKVVQIYVSVAKLASLDSEGKRIGLSAQPPTITVREGSSGPYIIELQFILNYLAQFHPTIPPVIQDGVFRATTTNSVKAFQRTFGLTQDGIVGPATWNTLYSVFRGIEDNAPVPPDLTPSNPPFPGTLLRLNSRGNSVRTMQQFLNVISNVHRTIPKLAEDGIFGPITQSATREFQRLFGLVVDGIIGPITWNAIVNERNRIIST